MGWWGVGGHSTWYFRDLLGGLNAFRIVKLEKISFTKILRMSRNESRVKGWFRIRWAGCRLIFSWSRIPTKWMKIKIYNTNTNRYLFMLKRFLIERSHQILNLIIKFDRWQVTGDRKQGTGNRWQVTCDRWQVTNYRWQVTGKKW